MILPRKPPLPSITQLIELVAPLPIEPPPSNFCFRVVSSRLETNVVSFRQGAGAKGRSCVDIMGDRGIVVICEVVLRGVPERSSVRHIGEHAKGKDVRMGTGLRVHGMASEGAVEDGTAFASWTFAFLNSFVGVCDST